MSDRSHHVLHHPDSGMTAVIDRDGVTWQRPDGTITRDNYLLWPPRVYAARLCKLGFLREGRGGR